MNKISSYPLLPCYIIIFLVWGIDLLIAGDITMTSEIAPIFMICKNVYITGIIFLVAGLLAAYSLKNHNYIYIMPQHIILIYSMIQSIKSIILGEYSDGYKATHFFIFNDQIKSIMLICAYTILIINLYKVKK